MKIRAQLILRSIVFEIYLTDVYVFPRTTQSEITCSKLTIETPEQSCEICSKLTIKPPTRRLWRRFGGFIVNFEHISHLFSTVSIVNFEQVNAGWKKKQLFSSNEYII